MPKLTIVIGANGAGKSTWCDQHRARRLPTDFYNADSIAQGLGSWNSPSKQGGARKVVDRKIKSHLAERSDCGFESTYSGSSRPDIVRRAKEASYSIEAIFVPQERPARRGRTPLEGTAPILISANERQFLNLHDTTSALNLAKERALQQRGSRRSKAGRNCKPNGGRVPQLPADPRRSRPLEVRLGLDELERTHSAWT